MLKRFVADNDLMDDETKEYFIERCIEIAGDGLECKWPFVGNGVAGHVAEAQVQRDLLAFAVAVADERPDVFNRYVVRQGEWEISE